MVLILAGCSKFTGELPSESENFAIYAKAPGRLFIVLHDTNVADWRIQIVKGQVSKVAALPLTARQASSARRRAAGPPVIPRQKDLEPTEPFAYSPDKNYVVSGMDLKPPHESLPHELVMVRLNDQKILFREVGKQSSVEAVAWSPDSAYFAILWRAPSGTVIRSPMDILSAMSGHPVPYSDFWIEIVGVREGSLGRVEIASKVGGSWGTLVWTQ